MKNTLFKLISVLMLAALLAAALPLQSAFAAGLGEEPQPPDPRDGSRMVERKFKLEQRRYEGQGKAFDKSDDLLAKAQEIITRAGENGLDTGAAQSALDDFETAIAEVKPLYGQAGELIDDHAGFDGSGKVTDRAAARQTLQDGRNALDSAKDKLVAASEQLKDALRKWRQAQQPKP